MLVVGVKQDAYFLGTMEHWIESNKKTLLKGL